MATVEDRQSRTIHTGACLVIGDEVLGGKTVDTNSNFMAKWCFSTGISMKRIEVIEDDEEQIVEAVRRMSEKYDFVVTSGGIGPTHDDITYDSIAKAFSLPLVLHEPAFERMKRISPDKKFDWETDSPQRTARMRMVRLPIDAARDEAEQVIFPQDDLWVPVSVVNGNVYILPGVPQLFRRLLDGLKPHVLPRLADPEGGGIHRVSISTPQVESQMAEYLTRLAEEVEPRGVKVGSYTKWSKDTNTVTLVGRDSDFLESIAEDVARNLDGKRVAAEDEDEDEDENDEPVTSNDAGT